MNNLERLMICEMRDMDDADRLLQALETETRGTLAAWAEALTAPRMLALLNATMSDDDPEGYTELKESLASQADFEAFPTPSPLNPRTTAELHPNPNPSRSLRRVPRLL